MNPWAGNQLSNRLGQITGLNDLKPLTLSGQLQEQFDEIKQRPFQYQAPAYTPPPVDPQGQFADYLSQQGYTQQRVPHSWEYATGQLQDSGYRGTFPTNLNIGEKMPTYSRFAQGGRQLTNQPDRYSSQGWFDQGGGFQGYGSADALYSNNPALAQQYTNALAQQDTNQQVADSVARYWTGYRPTAWTEGEPGMGYRPTAY